MGNASSKAARRLSREAARPDKPLAFERREQAIERDAKDPHLVQNLSRLGPVSVHPTHVVRAQATDTQHMFGARARAEQEAANEAPNRLRAASLAALLDARKAGGAALEGARGRVDDATLRLLWGVNTPSVDARTVVRTRDEHGEESVTMRARWVDSAR